MGQSRRSFLTRIAAAGGATGVYMAMQAMGLLDDGTAHAAAPALPRASGEGTRVVILGAGLAGMSAAYELRKAGYAVTILEASYRAGGRVRTVRHGDRIVHENGDEQVCDYDDGLYFNAGAARIPGHHQVVLGYCREFGVDLEVMVNQNYNALLQSDAVNGGRPVPMRETIYGVQGQTASLLAKAVRNGGVDTPLSREDVEKLVEGLVAWGDLDADLAFRRSARLGYASAPGAGAAAAVSREAMDLKTLLDPTLWQRSLFAATGDMQATMLQAVGGMDRIPAAFEARLRDVIRLNAEVVRLTRRGGQAEIHWKDRRTGETQAIVADHCICTIPLTVLADIPNDFSPERQAVIRDARYGGGFKIAYQTPRFWEQDASIYGGLSFTDRDTFMTWYPSGGFHRPKGVLVAGYAFGEQGRRMFERSPAERDAYARATVERLHPGRSHLMEKPLSIYWAQVPFARGVTSDVARTNPSGYALICEPEGPYVFAGEHTAHTGAWMQGAILGGWRAVEQIAARRQAAAA